MADYRLKQSGDEVQSILDNAALRAQLTAETERATTAEQTLQGKIDIEEQAREDADAALQRNINTEAERAAAAEQINSGAIATERNRAEGAEETLQDNIDAEEQSRTDADLALQANIDAEQQARENAVSGINAKIPAAASAQNKLVDQNLMNSSIQTATAVFRGTFNLVSDLHLTVSATRAQIIEALASVIHESDNNDYCFVQIPVADDKPTEIASVDRYKFNGSAWAFEYSLNNSGFTAAQWDALNSGITSGLVTKLIALPTNDALTALLLGKQDVIADLAAIRSGATAGATAVQPAALAQEQSARQQADTTLQGNIDTEENRAKAAEQQNASDIDAEETARIAAVGEINAKIPSAASPQNKLADQQYVNSSVATNTATFQGSYNLVSDLHLAVDASRATIATELASVIASADNNDYCFVQIPTSAQTPTEIARVERYKFNGSAWAYEYTLNNSGFTAAQWEAINSAITSGLVAKLAALPTNEALTALLAGKQAVIEDLAAIRQGAQAGANAAPQATTYTKTEVNGLIGAEETRAEAAEQANANAIAAENTRAESAEGTLQDNIDAEETARISADETLQDNIDAEESARIAAVGEINAKIPAAASPQNKLADQNYVNSSVATNTATYRGSYNLVSDLSLTTSATEQQIATALAGEIDTADNNDYCFVQIPAADATPTVIARVDRYKFDGTAWSFEYSLNNSGFTAAQWDAINSAITSGLVTKLSALPTNAELTALLLGKQDVIADLATIRSGAAAGATAYQKPSTGIPQTDLTVELQLALASFITTTSQNLAYYYLKSETYSATQIDAMIAAIKQFSYESVQTLPEASTQTVGKIYLVPSAQPQTQNVKDEYITLTTIEEGTTTYSWECIGSTDVNLTNYYTKAQTDTAITAALNNALAAYSTTTQVGTMISSAINSALQAYATKEYVSSQVQEYAGTFRGTYDTIADLEATTGNHHNDYAWVKVTDSDGDNDYDRYKYNGSDWVFEYRLNNTHFTSDELSSIRSGMTTAKREKLDALPTNADLNTKFYALTRHTRLTDFDLNVLKQAVADQNLEKYGLKPGDQKTINGHTYVIAGLNPMKGTTTPYRVTANHVGLIVIPHTTQTWNASGNTSTGADSRGAGYMNCDLHYYLKNTLLPLVETDLGAANLIGHSKLLTNAVNTTGINRYGEATGCSSGWAWEADCKICALSEVQVYGGTVWSSSGYDTGEACRQLDVFQAYSHTEIFGGEYPWLRDVVSASFAAYANNGGNANNHAASNARYVAALILFH